MGIVYLRQNGDREEFARKAFQQFDILGRALGKYVLLKPNIVSSEPYPTTTHPATVEACLNLLQGVARKVIVADGPAWDAGDTQYIIEEHLLNKSCEKFGVPLTDLFVQGTKKVRMRSFELEISLIAFECDLIVSLPVLKVHGICDITGALKNHVGFLSTADKKRLHRSLDVHKVIAELNEVIKPSLHIVDGMQTIINTNELRHGGKLSNCLK
jgi:uncharacterized protein (DUF362 family)